jgi:hypothetical protein
VRFAWGPFSLLDLLTCYLYRADYNKGQCTQPVNKRDESEAGSVKDEAGDSVTEPEAPLVVRRSHSREFEA